MAVRSESWVCGLSLVGIVGSNPAGVMEICLVSVVCCQVEVSEWGWSLFQRSSAECGLSECDPESSTMRKPSPTRVVMPWWKIKDKESVMKIMETWKSTRIKWVEYVCVCFGTRITVVGDVYTGVHLHTSFGNSVVVVVSRLRAGWSGVRIPTSIKEFYLFQNVQTRSGAHSVSNSVGTEFLYWG